MRSFGGADVHPSVWSHRPKSNTLALRRRSGDLIEIAWLAQNLSELKIWVEYCSLSIINTLEFHENVIRGLVDINVKIGGLDK